MRPLSFTKNLGGLPTVYHAIRRGYAPGITADEFRRRCGLSANLSLLVAEFFLFTQVRNRRELIVADTLVEQSVTRPAFDLTLARLYFFALNLAMPGERLSAEQREAGTLQRHVITRHVYVGVGWRAARFDKDRSLEPFVRRAGRFESVQSGRKWVNNYWYIKDQCRFVERPDGTLETFPDTWGLLGLRLFFDRHTALHPTDDVATLVQAAYDAELHKLVGVPRTWLDERVEGAADMYLQHDISLFEGAPEGREERDAARRGEPPTPPPGTEAARRLVTVRQLVRRRDNRRFIHGLYEGRCQLSGIILRLPGGDPGTDCAHIRPLGSQHRGPDDVRNMLSLSPTMHRLFDRGCIRIEPGTHSVRLLHGNAAPHLKRLLVKPGHNLEEAHIRYYNAHLVR